MTIVTRNELEEHQADGNKPDTGIPPSSVEQIDTKSLSRKDRNHRELYN